MKTSSHKIIFSSLSGLILAVFLASCAAGPTGDRDSGSGDIAVSSDGLTGLDLGEDWDRPRRPTAPSTSADPFRPTPTRPGGVAAVDSPTAFDPRLNPTPTWRNQPAEWAIVLFTYTDPEHVTTSEYVADQLRNLDEEFRTVRARERDNGSMVLYGNYTGRDDPRAREDLMRLRSLTRDGQRLFPRIILTYLEADVDLASLPAYDLRRVRLHYPKNQTLSTLDVAVWSTFDDESLNYEQLKRRAEAYATQLRNQGHEAYFYHNEQLATSSVTVGLFGSDAVEPESGLYSQEVMRYFRLFPVRLNNEQPLLIADDGRHPERGSHPQAPVLVEVP